VTEDDTQREMVGDLRAAKPRVVVVWRDPTAVKREPNAESSGVVVLDTYLRGAYRRAARFGNYEVLVSR
jgi:hypothetical protein